jgi:Zn-dependent peptidase ImmA (M78 family)
MKYRSLKSVKASEKQAFEGAAAAWFQIYMELENILEVRATVQNFTVSTGESDQAAAERLRETLGVGEQPLPSVIELLEKFGIRVIQLESPARIDGFAGWFGSTAVVALNTNLPNDRVRFNAAHELRHCLFDDCRGDTEESDEDERQAHSFASHLLMPEKVLRDAFATQSMVKLVQYKERFGISLAAMIYRARQGKIISQPMYERLWRDFSRLGWRKSEPGQVASDRPAKLEELIERAVSQQKLSYGDIARLGGLDEGIVRQRVLVAMGGEALRRENQ